MFLVATRSLVRLLSGRGEKEGFVACGPYAHATEAKSSVRTQGFALCLRLFKEHGLAEPSRGWCLSKFERCAWRNFCNFLLAFAEMPGVLGFCGRVGVFTETRRGAWVSTESTDARHAPLCIAARPLSSWSHIAKRRLKPHGVALARTAWCRSLQCLRGRVSSVACIKCCVCLWKSRVVLPADPHLLLSGSVRASHLIIHGV